MLRLALRLSDYAGCHTTCSTAVVRSLPLARPSALSDQPLDSVDHVVLQHPFEAAHDYDQVEAKAALSVRPLDHCQPVFVPASPVDH